MDIILYPHNASPETLQRTKKKPPLILVSIKKSQNIQAFEKLKALAQQDGIGKEVNKLVQQTGLNNYLCRRVFLRLYDDAVRRIERRNDRVKRFKEDAQDDLYRVMGRRCLFILFQSMIDVIIEMYSHSK